MKGAHPVTPDGRYFVVRGRLWRMANPSLPPERRQQLVSELMNARRALRGVRDDNNANTSRADVHRLKVALGERGAPWWTDGAKDYNRYLVKNTPYASWFDALPRSED